MLVLIKWQNVLPQQQETIMLLCYCLFNYCDQFIGKSNIIIAKGWRHLPFPLLYSPRACETQLWQSGEIKRTSFICCSSFVPT